MTLQFLLRRYILSLRKVPPNSHLVFRDGVSESEFSAVIDQGALALLRSPSLRVQPWLTSLLLSS